MFRALISLIFGLGKLIATAFGIMIIINAAEMYNAGYAMPFVVQDPAAATLLISIMLGMWIMR